MSIKNYGEISLIKIIKAFIHKRDLPECEDYAQIFQSAKRHSLGTTFYLAVKDDNNVPSSVMIKAQQHFAALAAQQVSQEYFTERLIEEFYQKKIKFMLLKGYYIKNFYPIKEMRSSCDVDIFYDVERKKEVGKILENLGFKYDSCSLSDEFYFKDKISFEMHFNLIASSAVYKNYYKDGFSLLKTKDGIKYEFTDDDFYIYYIVHAAKHFIDGGFGIRTVLDTYLCLRNLKLNKDNLNKELIKLGLVKFENSIKKLAYAWFDDGDIDSDIEILGEFVMDCATYGKVGNRSLLDSADVNKSAKSTKRRYIFRSIFPPYSVMKKRFKVLNNAPFLLPFVYVYRWFRTLFCRRDLIKITIDNANQVDDDKIKKLSKIKEMTGF